MDYIVVEGIEKHKKQLSFITELLKITGGYVAGGCFKNLFNNDIPRDIDIYFESENEFNNSVNFLKRNTSFTLYYENNNVIAFFYYVNGKKYVIELVRKMFLGPRELLDKFDFSICKFAVYRDKLEDEEDRYFEIYDKDFFEHLFLKKLVIDENIPLPYSTFTRMIKYIRYGYLPCMETKQKIVEALKTSKGELTDTSFYDGMD